MVFSVAYWQLRVMVTNRISSDEGRNQPAGHRRFMQMPVGLQYGLIPHHIARRFQKMQDAAP